MLFINRAMEEEEEGEVRKEEEEPSPFYPRLKKSLIP